MIAAGPVAGPVAAGRTAVRVRVTGVVQGVGFRPYVRRLAGDLHLDGHVGNDATGVFVEAEGNPDDVAAFLRRLPREAPPLAAVETVDTTATTAGGRHGFTIVPSRRNAGAVTPVAPDTAVCDACLAEMWDPADRRHGHPFITCTDCGPRFTIIRSLPYDRPGTTMAGFALCPACAAEHADPADRRHHAQPIGCHDCGPTLTWSAADGAPVTGAAALAAARRALAGGAIVAVKGVGGYHLVCDARSPGAVDEVRRRKGRADKPFAVMVPDVTTARRLAVLDDHAVALLSSPARPVVLAPSRPDGGLAAGVAPGNPLLGLVLPYTPVHHLLFSEPGPGGPVPVLGPLVVTSSNPSGEPICFDDADLRTRLSPLFDAVLSHDRPIHVPCDDSVVAVAGTRAIPLRRARGYAPLPVTVPTGADTLAVGGELKNAFCVATGTRAWMSQHIGDMGTLATLDAFTSSVAQFCQLYRVEPEVVATDAHPGYTSSRWARAVAGPSVVGPGAVGPGAVDWVPAGGARLVLVQHHHAHIASVMAEHGLDPRRRVIGVAFDGTGYGDDATVWGGEVLEADATGYTRVAHLAPVAMPGGDAAVDQPWRMALSHLRAAGVAWSEDLAPVAAAGRHGLSVVDRQLAGGFGCTATTSMGRLFDAVASLLGLRHHATYEAQAAIELEHAAARHHGALGPLAFGVNGDGCFDSAPVVAGLVAGLRAGTGTEALAAAFHQAVVDVVVTAATASRERSGLSTVALSGGVWQNALLLQLTTARLVAAGFDVRSHHIVPPNDGGLALGQLFVARHLQEV